jgi:acyl carrier protein
MVMSRERIFQKVQGVLVDALGVDEDEVQAQATLMGDLGSESIDFLDIIFRLEKSFNFKIPRGELFPAEGIMGDTEFVDSGKLTEKGLVEFKARMPHADFTKFEKNPDINKMGDLFTVNAIVNFLEIRVNAV